MDMGIRGWMIVIGVLLVVAVLLDGYRRMRSDRHGNIRMSLKMGGGFDKDIVEDLYGSELPNGGARVIARNDWETTPERREPSLGDEADSDSDEDGLPATDDHQPDPLFDDISDAGEAGMSAVRDDASPGSPKSPKSAQSDRPASAQAQPGKTPSYRAAPQDFIVVSVHARDGAGFKGEDLLHILLACDMRIGNKNIFHRYEEANGHGAVQFSVANMLEPGVFDLDNIQTFNTPGVTFFLTLPGPKDPEKAFEYMVETANCVAKNLGGDLKDESHSVMTVQTLEHFKQRVKDFERKSLAHA